MTENVKIAAIIAVAPVITSSLTLLHQVIRERKAEIYRKELRALQEQASKDIKTIEIATNSMKDALVQKTDEAARAEGHAAGMKEQKAETNAKLNQ